MALRDPHVAHAPTPDTATLAELDDRRRRAQQLLRGHAGPAAPAALRRHMDACVAVAVQAGLSRGTAMAAHAAALESAGDDLARADRELAEALRRLLGIDSLRQEW